MEKNLRHTGPEGTPILDTVNKIERLYLVPHGYFEGLAEETMTRIRMEAFSANMGYQVPEGYFSGLAGQIMSRIQSADESTAELQNDFRNPLVAQELAEVAPLLLQIGNKNVYGVPTGYFESLSSDQAMGTVAPEASARLSTHKDKGGKVIALTPSKRIWRSAVAAAAVLVVLFSGEHYFTKHHDTSVTPATKNQFASKINTNMDSFPSDVSTLSDEEIMGYLSTPEPSLGAKGDEIATEETQKAISTMTNEELENYLDRTPATY